MQNRMWINPAEAIAERAKGAVSLAAKYPELKRDTFEEFIEDAYDAGLELDFVTANEMYENLIKQGT